MSLWGSQYASHVKELLHCLDDDKLMKTANTACNGNLNNPSREDCVEIILRYTTDLGRLFAYQKVTLKLLRDYLQEKHGLIYRYKGKEELVKMIKDKWDNVPVEQEDNTKSLWGSQEESKIKELLKCLDDTTLRALANTACSNRITMEESRKNDVDIILHFTDGLAAFFSYNVNHRNSYSYAFVKK